MKELKDINRVPSVRLDEVDAATLWGQYITNDIREGINDLNAEVRELRDRMDSLDDWSLRHLESQRRKIEKTKNDKRYTVAELRKQHDLWPNMGGFSKHLSQEMYMHYFLEWLEEKE